jgi:hypothetical protein
VIKEAPSNQTGPASSAFHLAWPFSVVEETHPPFFFPTYFFLRRVSLQRPKRVVLGENNYLLDLFGCLELLLSLIIKLCIGRSAWNIFTVQVCVMTHFALFESNISLPDAACSVYRCLYCWQTSKTDDRLTLTQKKNKLEKKKAGESLQRLKRVMPDKKHYLLDLFGCLELLLSLIIKLCIGRSAWNIFTVQVCMMTHFALFESNISLPDAACSVYRCLYRWQTSKNNDGPTLTPKKKNWGKWVSSTTEKGHAR